MALDVFQDKTKMVPRHDNMIVRVPMDEQEVGGRKSHLPSEGKSEDLSIKHVPSNG